MNILARELNSALDNSVAGRLLSELGRRMYFPKGIVSQAAEAGKKADRYNATVGMAYEDGSPMILPSVAALTPGLNPVESVSYAPVSGVEELRKLWKDEMLRKNPSLRDGGFSLPVVVPGLTPGISIAADLLVNKGDVVIIPDLFWDNYELIFADRLQARIVPFPFFDVQWNLNIPALKEAILGNASGGKIILLLNFPNNPAGYAPSKSESAALAKAVRECAETGIDIAAITDDAYYGMFYESGTAIESSFAALSALHERVLAVKIDGSTKEDFVWGFRVAFLTFGSKGMTGDQYDALTTKTAGAVRAAISNSSRMAQSIMIKVMKNPAYHDEKKRKQEILRERYIKVKEILKTRTKGKALHEIPFNSGYFMSFECRGISADALRRILLERGIGTIALQDRLLRVAYASIDVTGLEELYREIFAAADELTR